MSVGVKVAETSRNPSAVTSVIRHIVRAGSESRREAFGVEGEIAIAAWLK